MLSSALTPCFMECKVQCCVLTITSDIASEVQSRQTVQNNLIKKLKSRNEKLLVKDMGSRIQVRKESLVVLEYHAFKKSM